MTVDEFVDKVKGELELFREEVKKPDSPLDPTRTPPLVDLPEDLKDAMSDVPKPDDLELWLAEFSGWRAVDPDNPDQT